MNRDFFEVHTFNCYDLPLYLNEATLINDATYDGNWHPNIEIIYIDDGCGTVTCNSIPYNVSKNDIFIINSNLPHKVGSKKTMRYHYLIPDRDFCKLNGIDTNLISFKQIVRDNTASDLYNNVVSEYNSNSDFHSAGVRHAVISLLLYLARNYSANSSQRRPGSKEDNIHLAIGFIYSNFNKQLNLEDIAAQVGLSKYYFCREFKRMTNETPFNFIHRIRCEYAKKAMLSYGKKSLCEISEMCGFENTTYFTKVFKRFTGYPPSVFLKNSKLNEAIPGDGK